MGPPNVFRVGRRLLKVPEALKCSSLFVGEGPDRHPVHTTSPTSVELFTKSLDDIRSGLGDVGLLERIRGVLRNYPDLKMKLRRGRRVGVVMARQPSGR